MPRGPDAEALIRLIRETWPETDVATNLTRPGVLRLNMGVDRATFDRLVGGLEDPDYTAMDRILPRPMYAKQHWVSILNPSDATMRDLVMPLLTEAHDRPAAQRERNQRR